LIYEVHIRGVWSCWCCLYPFDAFMISCTSALLFPCLAALPLIHFVLFFPKLPTSVNAYINTHDGHASASSCTKHQCGACCACSAAGNFISAISGKVLTAAACLCELASAAPAWTLPSLVTTCASQSVLLVSDGVAGVLQAGNSYSRQAAGGSHMLLTARAALPLAPSFGHSPSGRQHGPQTARHTLGGWSVAISRSVEGSIKHMETVEAARCHPTQRPRTDHLCTGAL
jgi:hypothetical protein